VKPSKLDLVKLADIVGAISGVAGGAVPLLGDVALFGSILKTLGHDLTSVPTNADGTPTTVDQAMTHLTLATTESHVQDDRIRAQAQAALDENARNG
jgi:hypothetical protein